MERIYWTESDINEIKIELGQERRNTAERLSNRLGVDVESVKEKIKEVEIKENLKKIASYFKETVKKE